MSEITLNYIDLHDLGTHALHVLFWRTKFTYISIIKDKVYCARTYQIAKLLPAEHQNSLIIIKGY